MTIELILNGEVLVSEYFIEPINNQKACFRTNCDTRKDYVDLCLRKFQIKHSTLIRLNPRAKTEIALQSKMNRWEKSKVNNVVKYTRVTANTKKAS
jgi:hypothetical protein